MKTWLLIKEGIVLDIIQQENNVGPDDSNVDYDTIQNDEYNLFQIGDSFTIEKYNDLRPKSSEEILQSEISKAKWLLDSTEFKFNVDYDLKDTDEWLDLKTKRQIAREFIRSNQE